jgi:uncharacterized protein
MAAFAGPLDYDFSGNGPASMAQGQYVSGDFFATPGVNAIIGRPLGISDDSPSAPPAIVLSYAYWQRARPFVDAMADDFAWTVTGATAWSKTYQGKKVVVEELLGTLREWLEPPIVIIGQRFIADGEFVAVEARGTNRTKEGMPYENKYCFVFRVADRTLRELTEYLDTELVTRAFGGQAGASATAR